MAENNEDKMFILLSGSAEVYVDLSQRRLTDIDIKHMEFDLELNKEEVKNLLQARLSNGILISMSGGTSHMTQVLRSRASLMS